MYVVAEERELLNDCQNMIIRTGSHEFKSWGTHPKERHWTMDALITIDEYIRDLEEKSLNAKKIKNRLELIYSKYYPKEETNENIRQN